MAEQLDTHDLFQKLQLPNQDIELLPFCGSNKVIKVTEWVNSLKSTQSINTCNQLYQAIPQILRLITSASERKQMLDAFFLASYPATLGLSKEFLNQPLALPQQAQNAALLAQALLKSIVTGYFLCLKSLCEEKKVKLHNHSTIAEIIFNALQCLTLMQLRNAQLYSQASPIVWRYANSLFLLAKEFHVIDKLVKSPYDELQNASALHIYLRMAALACARLNQITQIDMGNVFTALENWARAIKINTPTPSFWVDLNDECAPYAQQRTPAPSGDHILTIDFTQLTQQIANLLDGEANLVTSGPEITIPPEINSPTAMHLEQAWGKNVDRENHRHSSNHTAEIVVGFTLCHSTLSGIDDFSDFIGQTKSKNESSLPFLSNLLGSLTPGDKAKKTSVSSSSNAAFRVTTQNISKDGYCFKWEGQQPIRIDAGDVICIREHAKRSWGIGVIRWIRKYKQHSLLGIQLLSNRPTAAAASCHFDDGSYSDFMRTFLLPSSNPHQGPSLLTPNIVFKDGAKIKIKQNAVAGYIHGRITECTLTTGRTKSFQLQTNNEENGTHGTKQHEL